MNRRLMQTSPFIQVGLMAIVLSFTAVACVAQRAAVSDAQVSSSAEPVEAEVLLYTDNTPGSIFWAKTEQEVSRRGGMAVEVVTDEEAFIEALPERMWKQVVVVARYKRGEPSYAAALRTYMRTDEKVGELSNQELFDQYGRDIRVRFYYWLDNPTSPVVDVPSTHVMACTLTQDWTPTGSTSISYFGGCSDDPELTFVRGYAFAAPAGVSPDSIHRFKSSGNSVMKAIEPGVYASKVIRESEPSVGRDGNNNGEGDGGGPSMYNSNGGGGGSPCNAPYFEDIATCLESHNSNRQTCLDTHGPGEGGNSGDPNAMEKCLKSADKGDLGCRAFATGRYVFCIMRLALARPEL